MADEPIEEEATEEERPRVIPGNVIVVMRKCEFDQVIDHAVEKALGRREEIIDEVYEDCLFDVKLLMKKYRSLKIHYEETADESLEVESIADMKHKTGLMVSHVIRMVDRYGAECMAGSEEDKDRWYVLYWRWIDVEEDRKSVDEIIGDLCIDKSTYYRYINKAYDDLVEYLFGVKATLNRKKVKKLKEKKY